MNTYYSIISSVTGMLLAQGAFLQTRALLFFCNLFTIHDFTRFFKSIFCSAVHQHTTTGPQRRQSQGQRLKLGSASVIYHERFFSKKQSDPTIPLWGIDLQGKFV